MKKTTKYRVWNQDGWRCKKCGREVFATHTGDDQALVINRQKTRINMDYLETRCGGCVHKARQVTPSSVTINTDVAPAAASTPQASPDSERAPYEFSATSV